jgi:hypothetical protein
LDQSRFLRNRRRQRRRKECGTCGCSHHRCCAKRQRRSTRRGGCLSARLRWCRGWQTLVWRGSILRCESLSRRDCLRLAARVGDSDGVGRVVNDHCVVNIIVDNVLRRRRHIGRWIVICRDRNEVGSRQHVDSVYGRRRREDYEVRRRRFEEKYRRRQWREEPVVRIIKDQYRPAEIYDLFFQRRRHIVSDDSERRRRVKCCGQIGQATVRVRDMRAARIPAQVGPI